FVSPSRCSQPPPTEIYTLSLHDGSSDLGVLICWDQWYPEAARITAMKGAEILFYPTAIGWATDQDEQTNEDQYSAWQLIQRSHADRKSTRLNSSHVSISYAVFCLKKKNA